ncbi:MAG: hypothetical protein GYB65_19085, partial [Chloroflexi bacterium]|nr:hypothetical protein [Chloroflexota bacterium]
MRFGFLIIRRVLGFLVVGAVIAGTLGYVVYAANGILDEVDARDIRKEHDKLSLETASAIPIVLTEEAQTVVAWTETTLDAPTEALPSEYDDSVPDPSELYDTSDFDQFGLGNDAAVTDPGPTLAPESEWPVPDRAPAGATTLPLLAATTPVALDDIAPTTEAPTVTPTREPTEALPTDLPDSPTANPTDSPTAVPTTPVPTLTPVAPTPQPTTETAEVAETSPVESAEMESQPDPSRAALAQDDPTPTRIPTNTLRPTWTVTRIPTNTLRPTFTLPPSET